MLLKRSETLDALIGEHSIRSIEDWIVDELYSLRGRECIDGSLHSENAPRAKRHLDNYGSEWSNIWPYSYLGVPEWIENAIGSILFMALAKKKPQRRVLGGY